jgi:hypothetical protein
VTSKKSAGANYHFERTYWIEKEGKVFRKIVDRAKTSMPTDGMPFEDETTILYPVADFPSHDADDVFNFRPPREAMRVATLDPGRSTFRAWLSVRSAWQTSTQSTGPSG